MKKIALVGNVNNNFFAITRHLRDMDYDAHLFYRFGAEHFQPAADTFRSDHLSYCHRVDWIDKGLLHIDEQDIRDSLSGFDFYIGQGDEAAAAYRAGFNMDVYYPYGSDVYKYAQLPQTFLPRQRLYQYIKSTNFRQTYTNLKKGTASASLRGAIVNAKNILADHTNDDFEAQLNGLQCKGKRWYSPMPFIYDKEYENINEADVGAASWLPIIQDLRKESDFLILYHGRQEWKSNYNEFTPKNTHHLIIGFADYIKANPGSRSSLIMLEYGYDLEHSKNLIEELGISEQVVWLPKMYRKEIMYLISKVDVCCGEFGRSYLTFGTIVEAMLLKKPVIHFRDDSLYSKWYPELYPLLNAREPGEIRIAIEYAVSNRDAINNIGEKASAWVKKYFIEQPLQTLQGLIESGN